MPRSIVVGVPTIMIYYSYYYLDYIRDPDHFCHKLKSSHPICSSDAVDGYSISECWSMACLASPCPGINLCADLRTAIQHVQGTDPSASDSWSCKCAAGFLADSPCAPLSVCDNNPCQFGATCVPISGSGYMCLCPFRKHGHFCDRCE